jgi:trans-aconitate 2-methyltransferase
MSKDAWNPLQYEKFKDERSQPFFDLMALLQTTDSAEVVDLGCGTGELTKELHQRLNAKVTVGVDSSEEMLKKAAVHASDKLIFKIGNIENWSDPKSFDIIFSNAALQWCTDHARLFKTLKESLRNKGQLAVQMPMNHEYPTHILASQMSNEEPWFSLMNSETYEKQKTMLTPEKYATLMFHMGFKEQKVLLRVYGHKLHSREGVLEWVKGSLLTHFKSRMSEADYNKFLIQFQERLFERIPDEKPFFYPFKRILIWGRL